MKELQKRIEKLSRDQLFEAAQFFVQDISEGKMPDKKENMVLTTVVEKPLEHIEDFEDYEFWYGADGWDWHYLCYYATGINSVDINLMDFINDAIDRGYLQETDYLHCIEAGFEICNGGQGLSLIDFEAEVSAEEILSPSINGAPLPGYLMCVLLIIILNIKNKKKKTIFTV